MIDKLWDVGTALIGGVLGYGGQEATNKSNRKIAREQMQFQERMSSTSAQRAVEDYRAAGLNPALAYDRGASSPGGASAVMGNALGSGVASARDAYATKQQLKQAAEMHNAMMDKVRAETTKTRTDAITSGNQGALLDAQWREMERVHAFNTLTQPFEAKKRETEAILQQLMIPGSRNTANFEDFLGRHTGVGGSALRALNEAIKTFKR